MEQQWEYSTDIVVTADPSSVSTVLNRRAEDGWEFVSNAVYESSTAFCNCVLIFKRKKS